MFWLLVQFKLKCWKKLFLVIKHQLLQIKWQIIFIILL